MGRILWLIAAVIVAVWVVGLVLDLVGTAIHLLLVVAAVVILINLFTGRSRV